MIFLFWYLGIGLIVATITFICGARKIFHIIVSIFLWFIILPFGLYMAWKQANKEQDDEKGVASKKYKD